MTKHTLSALILAGSALVLTAGTASAQSVALTAARQTLAMPDGSTVPMWGWHCGAAVTATCTATSGAAQAATGWQPPLIRVPYTAPTVTGGVATGGTALSITLTNNLPVPTSLTLIGQTVNAGDTFGAGNPTRESGRPQHSTQTATTWTTVAPTSGTPSTTPGTPAPNFVPPAQGARARSFVQEAAAATGTVTYTWTNLAPGTYLIESGTYQSIQGPMGLYGVLVVTTAPVGTGTTAFTPGVAYPSPTGAVTTTGIPYDADGVVLLSEIDAVQNSSADTAVLTTGFNAFTKWTPACGAPLLGVAPTATSNTCYPPAVDFAPTYYLINGKSFDRTNPAGSAVSLASNYSSGNVLLRYVNAGLRMHVPSVVGLQMTMVAEDGHMAPDMALALTKGTTLGSATAPCPSGNLPVAGGCPKTQNDWFMAAGKVYDIVVHPTGTAAAGYTSAFYPTFDRELSLSTNNERDGGMQALVVVNGGAPTVNATGTTTAFANVSLTGVSLNALAVADNFILPAKATGFTGNVLANDVGITNPVLSAAVTGVTLSPNGTFTYTGTTAVTFNYCGTGNNPVAATNLCAAVTITPATVGGAPTAKAQSFSSNVSTLMSINLPGVLTGDTDTVGYALTAAPGVATQTAGTPFTSATGGCTITLQANGSFVATSPIALGPNTCTFTYTAVNTQKTPSPAATVTLSFPKASSLAVTLTDAISAAPITDYKWIIEQDLSFKIDPACQQNGAGGAKPTTCPAGIPPTLATNFHTSFMPVIASGCTGAQSCERGQSVYNPATGGNSPAVCEHGICTPSAAGTYLPISLPSQVALNAVDPDGVTPARYYISILPGDSSNAANIGNVSPVTTACQTAGSGTEAPGQAVTACGHTMGGAPIPAGICAVTTAATATTPAVLNCTPTAATPAPFAPLAIKLQPNPLLTAQLTLFVFEDDAPLNGEHDVGGNDLEPGLGGFQAELWDEQAQAGDFTGQMTYDAFNMPLSNALNGTIDPLTGLNACPTAPTAPDSSGNTNQVAQGMIVVCPRYESDGITPSPLVGQAQVKNLMPGRFGVIVHPSAAREAAGEVWYQTNTLDGSHYMDSFVKVGEPAYFQEYGPGGWHVFMGMANPGLINGRKAAFCNGPPAVSCGNTIKGQVSNLHESRAPSELLFDSGVFPQGTAANYAPFAHTTCWAALGDPDGLTFAFVNCDSNGNYTFNNIPDGNWSLTVGDQWDDIIIDGSSKPVNLCSSASCPAAAKTPAIFNMDYPVFTWQTHIWTNIFMDLNGNGIQDVGEPGVIQAPVRIRFRNGRFNNTLNTDSTGHANFNETFPLFSWYVIESDNTRFKNTGVHVVYDAGGQVDGPTSGCLAAVSGSPCGNGNTAYPAILNSSEPNPLPASLAYPGTYYCVTADCKELAGKTGFPTGAGGAGASTGRIDPGSVLSEGLQGFLSQTQILEYGKLPYLAGENGGIRGHVVYSSTRPFDDPTLLFQNLWEPLVPNVTINLYQESPAPDGSTLLKLVDTTVTSSWDAFAQGMRTATVPNLNCPGEQIPANDPFFAYTLQNTQQYLHPTPTLPLASRYKCYDGMHNFNQVQPAPYDGLYNFPSAACTVAGATFTAPTGQTVTCATKTNPHATAIASPAVILPPGKYVVEVVVPQGYEIVKEEDKNILIGDTFVASATIAPQFQGLGDIFIVPDQASLNAYNPSYTGPITGSAPYNANGTPTGNNGNPTDTMGRTAYGGFGPGGLLTLPAPCVGEVRIVPSYMSISPEGGEVAPFAGASRPLCDRKELTLEDQMQTQADFFVWTKTPAAAHYTGFILDDFSSEFNQAAPTFGEKFAVPNLPIAIKDFNGNTTSRTYSDQWGLFNGLVYSNWDVSAPNPTGYAPNMMITEMNSPGPIPAPICTTQPTATTPGIPLGCTLTGGQLINDPYFNPGYSTFDYENPFMPGDATYLDTPVVPVMAFAEGYNPPDCAYPDATPVIKSVTGDTLKLNAYSGAATGTLAGPWVSAAGKSIIITAVGDSTVPNNAYSGPATSTAPFNLNTIKRHYGFGAATGKVTIGGLTATVTSWSDTSITATVPTLPTASTTTAPIFTSCSSNTKQVIAISAEDYSAPCGELVVTTAAGKATVDSVTVTVGPSAYPPTYIAQENATGTSLQLAVDHAAPGDLIIVGPGTYTEMLLMWKPLRLQGVSAASVFINANTQPAGRIDPWRRQVNCLFGLALNGQMIGALNPITGQKNVYDSTGTYSCSFGTFTDATHTTLVQAAVDPIELEPIIGWDANLNGNLSELLQEPTLMGAYEGAAITVLAKGLENYEFASAATDCGAEGNAACVPLNSNNNGPVTGTRPRPAGDCYAGSNSTPPSPFFMSNFLCNPARIDGLTLTNSSQGGGGLFIHGWNHNLEVSNDRITGNAGTLTGGITVGQAEVPDPVLGGTTGTVALALGINNNVNMHNNAVTTNSAYGDELNSNTPAAGGGVTITPGSDNYRFTNNWVCGNLSSGDGGGVSHFGLSYNGTISNNTIIFNQSSNPTLTTNGGGLIIQGNAPDGTIAENGSVDADAGPGLSDGVGPNMTVDSNLIMGNTAESGEGGGLRLQNVNGNDILNNPATPGQWYKVNVTNNIIANNVSGWNGAGVSILDAVNVNFINNTVISNDTTASAGVLFDTLGAQFANTAPPGCNADLNTGCVNPVTTSAPEPSGLVTHKHSFLLSPAFTTPVCVGTATRGCLTCPAGHPNCNVVSIPVLSNDVFYQNRNFYVTTSGSPAVVVLAPALTQTTTGSCPVGSGANAVSYWDIGIYGDTGPTNHGSGYTLAPQYSILTTLGGTADYAATAEHNIAGAPGVVAQYCNGSRVPPEISPTLCTSNANAPGCTYPGAVGITTPPGIPDNNPFYANFTLTPAATVDEGNNWLNLYYGPLSLVNPAVANGAAGYNTPLGNYALASATSAAVGKGISTSTAAPSTAHDFFGNKRPQGTSYDIGAVEWSGAAGVANPALLHGPALAPAPRFNNQIANTPAALLDTAGVTGTVVTPTTGAGGGK